MRTPPRRRPHCSDGDDHQELTYRGYWLLQSTIAAVVVNAARRCVVPKLTGDTLTKARQLLTRAHCTLGKVTEAGKAKGKQVVMHQQFRAGSVRAAGASIRVTLGGAPSKKG